MTKACNFCEKPIYDKKTYVQVEFRKRNAIARARFNGIFETYVLHKECSDNIERLMKKFTPEELDRIIEFGQREEKRRQKEKDEDEEKRLKCSKGACD